MNPVSQPNIAHIPVPTDMVSKKITNNIQPVVKNDTLVTQNAFKDCKKFTSEALQLTFSPNFSLFIQGIKFMCEPSGSGMLGGLNNGLGALMVMASPIWGLFRLGIGVPSVIGGLIATATTGIICGAEAIGKGIENQINQPTVPTKSDIQREELTKLFVQRMQEVIKTSSYPAQCFFKEDPARLISIVMIMVAFRSRDLDGKVLHVDKKNLDESEIQDQDEFHKQYFKDVCEMKYAIQSLHLSLDDNHAWDYLQKAFEKSAQINEGEILSYDERNEIETIQILMRLANGLGEKIVLDPTFNKYWNETL